MVTEEKGKEIVDDFTSPWKIEIDTWGGNSCVKYNGEVLEGITSIDIGVHSSVEAAKAKIEIEMPVCYASVKKGEITIGNKQHCLDEIRNLVEMGLLAKEEIEDRLK